MEAQTTTCNKARKGRAMQNAITNKNKIDATN